MIDFHDWMETALYDKERGYYTNTLDTTADYVTAVNFGPYLGYAVARELARLWEALPSFIAPKIFTLVEMGCGPQASIARGCLELLKREKPQLYEKTQVILVDRSLARLTAAYQDLNRLHAGKVFSCPDVGQIAPFWGAIVSNELFDALPVRLIRRVDQEQIEIAVIEEEPMAGRRLFWRAAKDPVLVSYGLELPFKHAYALNLEAFNVLKVMASRLEHGFILSIDFGDTRPRIFLRNPVKAFSQRQVKDPNLNAMGQEDVTSPVDFTLLADWGARLGLETIGLDTLTSFLIRNGMGDFFQEPNNRQGIENNLKLKTLLHPVGFGEDFKVLLQGK